MEIKVFKNLLWAIKNIVSFDVKYIIIAIFTMVIGGVSPAVYTILTQKIINNLQLSNKIIFFYLLLYVLLEFFESFFNNFIEYYKMKFNLSFNLMIKEKVVEKISNLKLKDFENSEIYDVINRAKNESEGKIINYIENFGIIISNIISFISFVSIILFFKFWIVIIILIIPCVKYIITKKLNILSFNIITERTNKERKAWYFQYLLTYGDFFKEIKLYNLFPYFIKKYKKYNEEFNLQDVSIARKKMLFFGGITLIEVIIDGFIFYKIISYGFLGLILIGNVLMYMNSVTKSKMKLTEILQSFAFLNKESLFMGQLIYFFDLEEVNEEELLEIEKIEKIECINLSYKYKKNKEYTLKNINIKVEKNKNILVVGRNGSGKTTLIKILLGLYDDYEGHVYIDGIELKNIKKSSYMKYVSSLFQDFIKYEGTFRENISYGDLENKTNDLKLYNVLEKFDLLSLVNRTEKKLDSQIGYWFDNGKQISLGEWQKIAISRAFLKKSNVIILDEPNSALDSISDYRLNLMYKDILKNKIGIIVIHKFKNIVNDMDRILVLNNGTIEEEGTHKDLVIKNGLYSMLYNLQK